MQNKYFEQFKKSGKIKDFLLYRYELAKEAQVEDDKKRRDNPKSDGLSRKP
ncbi:MAG: hypothetical protein R3Y60_02885 [bacterium]